MAIVSRFQILDRIGNPPSVPAATPPADLAPTTAAPAPAAALSSPEQSPPIIIKKPRKADE